MMKLSKLFLFKGEAAAILNSLWLQLGLYSTCEKKLWF